MLKFIVNSGMGCFVVNSDYFEISSSVGIKLIKGEEVVAIFSDWHSIIRDDPLVE